MQLRSITRKFAAPMLALTTGAYAFADSALVTAATTELTNSRTDAMAVAAVIISIAAAVAVVGVIIALVRKA